MPAPSSSTLQQDPDGELPEQVVIRGFHLLLQSAMTQAKYERILDEEMLEAADADVQIAGPALCFYFAALRAEGDPPTIRAPGVGVNTEGEGNEEDEQDGSAGDFVLTDDNCPRSFLSFFRMWQRCVPTIKGLRSDSRHDLCRILCDLPPLSSPLDPRLNRLASDLKAMAIEITQRRTFQERYNKDLQNVLDDGSSRRNGRTSGNGNGSVRPGAGAGGKRTSSYRPPPVYEAGPEPGNWSSGGKTGGGGYKPTLPAIHVTPGTPPNPLSPTSATNTPDSASSTSPAANDPLLTIVRETLYASLGDVMSRTPAIARWISMGPRWHSRAYFAAVSLALLEVAMERTTSDDKIRLTTYVRGPEGRQTLVSRDVAEDEAPAYLQGYVRALVSIGKRATLMSIEDDERAIADAVSGNSSPASSRLDRLKFRLENGAGERMEGEPDAGSLEDNDARTFVSLEGTVDRLANDLGELAVRTVGLKGFVERQNEVFDVLVAVHS